MKKYSFLLVLIFPTFISANAQRPDALPVARQQYFKQHLKLTEGQLNDLEKIHQNFPGFSKHDSTLNSYEGIYVRQQRIRKQDKELKRILSQKQYLQLKSDQEQAQKTALKNYYIALQKEKLRQQEKKANQK